mgnify:CR=1 FL=1|jgi:hypothetical protein
MKIHQIYKFKRPKLIMKAIEKYKTQAKFELPLRSLKHQRNQRSFWTTDLQKETQAQSI